MGAGASVTGCSRDTHGAVKEDSALLPRFLNRLPNAEPQVDSASRHVIAPERGYQALSQ
jgi:hypothetical protein